MKMHNESGIKGKTIAGTARKGKPEKAQPIPPSHLSAAWRSFQKKLASVLAKLSENEYLILTIAGLPNRFVQFAGEAEGLRAESVSNHYLPHETQLTDEEIAALIDLGWLAPTSSSETSVENDPSGSSNYFRDHQSPIDFGGVAATAVKTFVKVLQVSRPDDLQYEGFDSSGLPIEFDELGLKVAAGSKQTGKVIAIPEQLLATLSETTGLTDLSFDADGDVGGICYESATTYVRILPDAGYIRFYSIMVKNVEESPTLFARLNELNIDNGHLSLIATQDRIVARRDIYVMPYVSEHVSQSLLHFCKAVDNIKTQLQTEFGLGACLAEQNSTKFKH